MKFLIKLSYQIKNNNCVKKCKDFFGNDGKKKNLRQVFGNYQINYLTEFDLYKDIVSIVNIFCAKILFSRFM